MIAFDRVQRLFNQITVNEIDEQFVVNVDYNDQIYLGNGLHFMRYPLIGRPVCFLHIGYGNLKLFGENSMIIDPEQFFQLSFVYFHELHHGQHKLLMHTGLGLIPENKDRTIFYLAQASNPGFYRNGNQCNPFEVDANIYGTKKALEFCSKYWPGENFEQHAVDMWKKREQNQSVPFVDDLDKCNSFDNVIAGLESHRNSYKTAKPCRTWRDYKDEDGNVPVFDAVYNYLRFYASDEFVSHWKNAESLYDRAVLAAGVTVIRNYRYAKQICSNVDKLELKIGDYDVIKDVSSHKKKHYNRKELDWCNEYDLIDALRNAGEEGLSFEYFDELRKIVYFGMMYIVNPKPFNSGIEYKSLHIGKYDKQVWNDVSDLFVKHWGKIKPTRGEIPDVVKDYVSKVKQKQLKEMLQKREEKLLGQQSERENIYKDRSNIDIPLRDDDEKDDKGIDLGF